MEVDVSKQSLTINKLIGTKRKTVTIEGDMIVPDVKPDILSTIDSVGNICIYKKEVLDGRVRYDGGINVYLIYLADSETDITRGLNTTLDFTQMVDMDECKQDMDIMDNMQIKNIECNVLNGRKINIKVEVEISIQLFLNQSIEVLKEINNVSSRTSMAEKINNMVENAQFSFGSSIAGNKVSYFLYKTSNVVLDMLDSIGKQVQGESQSKVAKAITNERIS